MAVDIERITKRLQEFCNQIERSNNTVSYELEVIQDLINGGLNEGTYSKNHQRIEQVCNNSISLLEMEIQLFRLVKSNLDMINLNLKFGNME